MLALKLGLVLYSMLPLRISSGTACPYRLLSMISGKAEHHVGKSYGIALLDIL